MKWLLSQVADATQGRLIGNDVEVTGVSTDTRTVADGQLFIALSGERFDAHDFLDQAITAGFRREQAAGRMFGRCGW